MHRRKNYINLQFKRISACILSFLLCISLSACRNKQPSQDNISQTVPSETISEVSETTQISVVSTTNESTVTEVSSETTASALEETTTADTTVTETPVESEITTESSTEIITEATETASEVTEVTAQVMSAPPASVKQPAEVVIPDVKKVSSPGKSVLSSDNACIDYSNASSGYISAKYSGKSAKAKLRMICGNEKYDHNLSVGGVTEYFPLSMGSGEYQLQIFEQLDGKMYTNVLDEKLTVKITDETEMFLYPNKYVSFNKNSKAVKKSAEVCTGKTSTIDKLAAIFGCITSEVTYDKQLAATVQSGYVPDPDSVLSKKKGICFDYSSLFAAMARAQGIPTRLVVGYASPEIYHAWNEVYTTETGWISVEVYLKNKGYNLVDSTFYAGADDKKQIAEYIADNKNYSAIYYY